MRKEEEDFRSQAEWVQPGNQRLPLITVTTQSLASCLPMETGLPCCPSSPHLHRDTSKVPLDCLHFHIRQFYSKCSRSRSGLVGCLGHHMTLLLWCFCVGLGRINLTAFIGRLPPSSLVSCPCVFLSPLFFIPSPRLASPSHRLCLNFIGNGEDAQSHSRKRASGG